MMTLDQAAWLVLGLDAAMLVFTLALFVAGGMDRQTAAAVGGVGIVWLGVLRALLSNDLPFPEDISGVAFFGVVLVGVGLVGVLLIGPSGLRRTLGQMEQTWLLAAQGIRVFFGATFLLWAGEEILPRTFGIIDGFTHVTAGFLGLLAAWAAGRRPDAKVLPWTANLFGLGDILVVATSIALVLLGDIGPHHPMMYAVFAPAPVWLWLHVVSISRSVSGRRAVEVARDHASEPGASVVAAS